MSSIDWSNLSPNQIQLIGGGVLGLLSILLCCAVASRRLRLLAAVLGICAGVAIGSALAMLANPRLGTSQGQQEAADGTKSDESRRGDQRQQAISAARQKTLDEFRHASPAQRWAMVAELPDREKLIAPVRRGDVVTTVRERGTLDAAQSAGIFCRVRSRELGGKATTIKWLVAEGKAVKKGDPVVELDDVTLKEQLQAQRSILEQKRTVVDEAEKEKEIALSQYEIDIKAAKRNVAVVERELKKLAGDEGDQKEALQLKLEQAQQALKTLEAQGASKKTRAEAAVASAKAALDAEVARVKELETDIGHCRIAAPRDGMVMYHVPEQARFGPGQAGVAPGEPVREEQKLMQICDLRRMVVRTKIHEALIARVRKGQRTTVRVDALPSRLLEGRVETVATVAAQQDWVDLDVRWYSTQIALDNETPGLKPGMSAEVSIEVGRSANVVVVPLAALLGSAADRLCYVKTGAEIQERKLVLGLSNDFVAEIKEGVKEGDLVLQDPKTLADSLRGRLNGRDQGAAIPGRPGLPAPTEIVVRSVPPSDDAADRRGFVQSYGITAKDHDRLASIETVTRVVPVRSFPQEIRRLERMHAGRVVATTPEYAEANGAEVAAGRFLLDDDDHHRKPIAVLGAAVARSLFPGEDPLGQTVRLGPHLFTVAGLLHARPSIKDEKGSVTVDANADVYIPLQTARARFGQTVVFRQRGQFRAERVDLHELRLLVSRRDQVQPTADLVHALLEQSHSQKDWAVQTHLRE